MMNRLKIIKGDPIIIYQFHMLSDGIVKISKAEYKEAEDYKGNFCYKKTKVIEKGIRYPKFPIRLYKLGVADYNKYYALSMDKLTDFAFGKIDNFNNSIKSLENQIKKYKEMVNNLQDSCKVPPMVDVKKIKEEAEKIPCMIPPEGFTMEGE